MTNTWHSLLVRTLTLGRNESAKLLMCIATASLLVPGAQASFVNGSFEIGGTSVRATTNELLFYNLGVGTATPPTGEFVTTVPSTGSFAPGVDGTILDLTGISPDAACVGCGFAPVSTVLAIPNFILYPAVSPTITIELTGITAPSAPLCGTLTIGQKATAGIDCTPNATSTLLLTNVLNGSTGAIDTQVAISAAGNAWFIATPGQVSSAQISLASTFTGENINQVLNTESSQTFIDTGLDGQVVVTGGATPEPGTLSMMLGSGLLAFGLVLRRRRG